MYSIDHERKLFYRNSPREPPKYCIYPALTFFFAHIIVTWCLGVFPWHWRFFDADICIFAWSKQTCLTIIAILNHDILNRKRAHILLMTSWSLIRSLGQRLYLHPLPTQSWHLITDLKQPQGRPYTWLVILVETEPQLTLMTTSRAMNILFLHHLNLTL